FVAAPRAAHELKDMAVLAGEHEQIATSVSHHQDRRDRDPPKPDPQPYHVENDFVDAQASRGVRSIRHRAGGRERDL
ncbi:hypothetical protein, partial [Pseudomonas sp. MPR-LB5]|uniref:hypothetical protein n=1 Tax=Pseudomonas sp. MPR-LB5 TaxID=2070629 RepID=UPI001C4883A1